VRAVIGKGGMGARTLAALEAHGNSLHKDIELESGEHLASIER
jgi:hypothetical protein